MTAAILTPVTTDLAKQVGPRTFRKQLLPIRRITHKGLQHDFSRDYLLDLATAFKDRAYDSVKFFLAGPDNKHDEDMARMCGTVRSLELAEDGLDAVIEFATDEAAELVRQHPDLGVSARIIPGLTKSDGRSFKAAVKHVLGTIDPVVTGMRPWQAVDLAEENTDSDVDLTSATFDEGKWAMPELDEARQKRLDALLGLPDEQFDKLVTAPEANADDGKSKGGKHEAPKRPSLLARLRGKDTPDDVETELTDEELAQLAADAEAHANAEPANLSAEQQAALDLAQATGSQALGTAIDLATQLAASQWTVERGELVRQGVPPAILDLAEPVLKLPAGVIDLSNSDDGAPDPVDALRKVVDACKGTIDMSVIGELPEEDETAESQAQAVARQFIQEHGFGRTAELAKSKES